MSHREKMELPDFIDKYAIPHSAIHKQSGISYQHLNKIIERRETSKVYISVNLISGRFRIFHGDIGGGKLNTDLFKDRDTAND